MSLKGSARLPQSLLHGKAAERNERRDCRDEAARHLRVDRPAGCNMVWIVGRYVQKQFEVVRGRGKQEWGGKEAAEKYPK